MIKNFLKFNVTQGEKVCFMRCKDGEQSVEFAYEVEYLSVSMQLFLWWIYKAIHTAYLV